MKTAGAVSELLTARKIDGGKRQAAGELRRERKRRSGRVLSSIVCGGEKGRSGGGERRAARPGVGAMRDLREPNAPGEPRRILQSTARAMRRFLCADWRHD